MIIVYGTRLYGKIDSCGDTHVATRFFHISWLPLIPMGTQLVLEKNGGSYRFLPQSLSGRSVLAAYLRTWGVIAAAFVAWHGITGFVEALDYGVVKEMLLAPLSVFAAVGVVASAYFQLGRLSVAEKAQRFVYADYVGYPIDVAAFRDRDAVRRSLTEALAKKAPTLGLFGYRNEMPAAPDYPSMALDPTVHDLEFLNASLTLARIEW